MSNNAFETSTFDSREEYLGERRLLIGLEKQAADSFDKALITLSSGAIFLSVTFLDKFTGDTLLFPGFIYAAWSFFGISLYSILIAFLLSQFSMSKQQEIIQVDVDEGHEQADNMGNPFGSWAIGLSISSCVSFIIGTGFFIAFAISNLN